MTGTSGIVKSRTSVSKRASSQSSQVLPTSHVSTNEKQAVPAINVIPASQQCPSPRSQLPTSRTESISIANVMPEHPLPEISTSHRPLDKCPCNQSMKSWKIDCSKCHQFWHVECLKMDGLTEKAYNKMVHYLCPFCFVPPVPTIQSDVDVCHICRNTLTLQQSNSRQEVFLAANKMESLETFCKTVNSIDFESISDQLSAVQDLDVHLKHFLLDTDSLKDHQERVAKVDESIVSVSDKITQLQSQVTELLERPRPENEGGVLAHSDEFMVAISSKLDLLCNQEPEISAGLESLKLSVDALEKNTAIPVMQHVTPVVQPQSQPTSSDKQYTHDQEPVEFCKEEYITSEVENQLIQLFESSRSEFTSEGGRSVLYYGERYQYTGSTPSNRDCPIPPAVSTLMAKINSEICNGDTPMVNSCLVNRFEGPESLLPQHSDNELTIHPESKIITLSIGSECTLTFGDISNGNDVLQHLAKQRELYSMTRRSQEFYNHRIDQGAVGSGLRYSLTFRSIGRLNRNATCILGDSNTAGLKFGSDPRRSFGSSLPGKRFPAPLLDDVNPYNSCGYSNVVLMCGINNLKSDSIKTPHNVREVYNSLVSKVSQIQSINPKAHVYVCPVLPTKLAELNRKGMCFNNLILNELLPSNSGVTFVDGFQEFLDDHGLLNRELSRDLNRFKRPDFLHLNWGGLAKLGCLIRGTVLLRKSGGVDRRKRTRVDGTSYRDVAAGGVEQHDGYQPS